MEEIRILSPTAILGYGFPEESFRRGMEKQPHVIAVDAGSTDPGPYYLGAGISFTAREGVKRDLEFMIQAAIGADIPLIIGTAGGCGANAHLDWNRSIIEEIAREKRLSFRMATITSEISAEAVLGKMREGRMRPLHHGEELLEHTVLNSVRIVAQMGEEPIIEALDQGAQVILTGRAYDPAVFSALPISLGYDRGLATHLGKILECAAIAASPGSGSDCLLGHLGQDYFRLEALSPDRKCTTLSVAAHTLYEKTNPYFLPGPGGGLNLSQTTFTQDTEGTVTVRGTHFEPTPTYLVKIEGVESLGFRAVSFAAARDPIFISQVDHIVAEVKRRTATNFQNKDLGSYFLDFKLYGRNGVMSMFPAFPHDTTQEIGIVIEAVAATQEAADTLLSFARSTMLHYGYPGRKSTAGNLAFPFSPSDFKVGQAFAFSLYHLIELDSPTELFPIALHDVKN